MFEVATLRSDPLLAFLGSECGLRPYEVATSMIASGFGVYFGSNDLKSDSRRLCIAARDLCSAIENIRRDPD